MKSILLLFFSMNILIQFSTAIRLKQNSEIYENSDNLDNSQNIDISSLNPIFDTKQKKSSNNSYNQLNSVFIQNVNQPEYQIKNNNNKIIHYVYLKETTRGRKWGIVTLIIFGTSYLSIRFLYNFVKNVNRIFSKSVLALSNQILFLFISLSIFIIIYSYGAFDNIILNWEYIIAAISAFIIGWVFFNFFLIFLALSAIKKWENFEKDLDTFGSFEELKIKASRDKKYLASFEYQILKRYFYVPLFPVMKCSSLREELKFSIYLENCLHKKLKHFFKLSWTTWLSLIVVLMFWNVFVLNYDNFLGTILIIGFFPMIGIIILLFIYIYCISVYRKVVSPVTQENINQYKEYKFNDNDLYQSMNQPKYLSELANDEKMNKMKNSGNSLFSHFHLRPLSFYEENIFLGQTGLYLLLNIIQSTAVIFVVWEIGIFIFYFTNYIKNEGIGAILLTILVMIVYFLLYEFLVILAIKRLTVISSIEMQRNNNAVKKTIKKQLKNVGEISNNIYTNFKEIFFDIKMDKNNNKISFLNEEEAPLCNINNDNNSINNNLISNNNEISRNNNFEEFKLSYPNLKDFLALSFERFKKQREDNLIDIKTELRPFLKSCGNILNEKETSFLIHCIQSKYRGYNGLLSLEQLYDMCGIMLYFRERKRQDIIMEVFDYYYKQNSRIYKEKKIKWEIIDNFLSIYAQYFNEEEIKFLREQTKYIGEPFALDAFIMSVIAPGQYYPY